MDTSLSLIIFLTMELTCYHQDQNVALEHFICSPVTKNMIVYLANMARDVIQCNNIATTAQIQRQQACTSSTALQLTQRDEALNIPSLDQIITSLVVQSEIQVPTLMTTLLYLERVKQKLPPNTKWLRCMTHRIFLACLVLSAKFLNDSSPKNKHWAWYTYVPSTAHHDFSLFEFSRNEVNLMERQILQLLDWDLNFNLAEVHGHFEHFLAPIRIAIDEKRQSQKRATANILHIARPNVKY